MLLNAMTDACAATPRARATWAGAALAVLLVSGCQREAEPIEPKKIGKSGVLVVAVRAGPSSWYPGPGGDPVGFDHDLLVKFAAERKLKLEVVQVDSATAMLARVASGDVHIGAGGLYAPAPTAASVEPPTDGSPQQVLWTSGYFSAEPVLIYGADGFKPKSFRDLDGATATYVESTGIDAEFASLRANHPEVRWQALPFPSADALIAEVSEGLVDYAVVPSIDAAGARNIYLDFDIAFAVGGKRDLAWAVAPGQRPLRDDIDAFFARARKDGSLARYADRYFAHARQVERIDAGVFQERLKSHLPDYRKMFEEAQAATGIEWRLLAAVAYQESQWNAFATSETGVRGFMQITEETARHLGVPDRLDPRASTLGAARYLATLKSKLPARIVEPDRTWLALAAFNIGVAHLEDARVLAQKQKMNPDLWGDVRKALPLLALPEFHTDAKYGYARGGMPVVFVDRVRAYYDILLRHEKPFQPRLRAYPMFATP
jgi:membrane-bound lytic murein transglycosylase F